MSKNAKIQADIVFQLKGLNEGMGASFKTLETGFLNFAKVMEKTMDKVTGNMNADMKEFAGQIEQIAKMLENMQKVRTARTMKEGRELQSGARMQGIAKDQGGIAKRTADSVNESVKNTNYSVMKRIEQNAAAISSVVATKLKGAGVLKSDMLQGMALRSLTSIDKSAIAAMGKDNRKMMSMSGEGQKRSMEKFRQQLMKIQPVAEDNLHNLTTYALAGVTDQNLKPLTANLTALGKAQWKMFAGTDEKTKKQLQPIDFKKFFAQQRGTIDKILGDESRTIESKMAWLDKRGIGYTKESSPEGIVTALKPIDKSMNEYIKGRAKNYGNQIYKNLGIVALEGGMMKRQAAPDIPAMQELSGPVEKMRNWWYKITGRTEKINDGLADIPVTQDKLTTGIDSFGYRMITISYMMSKVTFALDQVIRDLKGIAITRLSDFGRIEPLMQGTRAQSGAESNRYQDAMIKSSEKYGISVNNLSKSLYDAASAFPYMTDKMAIMEATTRLTALGFGNSERVMEGLIAVNKTYFREYENDVAAYEGMMVRTGNMVAETVRLGVIKIEELAGAMQNMAPQAALLGIGVEELYASLTATAGIIGDTNKASTNMRQLFTSFLSPTTSNMREMYRKEGVSGGKELIDREGGILGAVKLLKQYAGSDLKSYTGRVQGAIAAEGLLKAQGDMTLAAEAVANNMFALQEQSHKAITGVQAMGIEFKAAEQGMTNFRTSLGEKMLPMQTALLTVQTNLLKAFDTQFSANFITFGSLMFKGLGYLAAFLGAVSLATRAITALARETVSASIAEKFAKKFPGVQAGPAMFHRTAGGLAQKVSMTGVGAAGMKTVTGGVVTALGAAAALASLAAIAVGVVAVVSHIAKLRQETKERYKKEAQTALDTTGKEELDSLAKQFQALTSAYEGSKTKTEESKNKALVDSFLKNSIEPFQADVKNIIDVITRGNVAKDERVAYSAGGQTVHRTETIINPFIRQMSESNNAVVKRFADLLISRKGKNATEMKPELEELLSRLGNFASIAASLGKPKTQEDYDAEAGSDAREALQKSLTAIMARYGLARENESFQMFNANSELTEAIATYAKAIGDIEAAKGNPEKAAKAMFDAYKIGQEIFEGQKELARQTIGEGGRNFLPSSTLQDFQATEVGALQMAIKNAAIEFDEIRRNASSLAAGFMETTAAAKKVTELESYMQSAGIVAFKDATGAVGAEMMKLAGTLRDARRLAFAESVRNKQISIGKSIDEWSGDEFKKLGRDNLLGLLPEAVKYGKGEEVLNALGGTFGVRENQKTGISTTVIRGAAEDKDVFAAMAASMTNFDELLTTLSDFKFFDKLNTIPSQKIGGLDYSYAGQFIGNAGVQLQTEDELKKVLESLNMNLSGDRQVALDLKSSITLFTDAIKELDDTITANARQFMNPNKAKAAGIKDEIAANQKLMAEQSLYAASTEAGQKMLAYNEALKEQAYILEKLAGLTEFNPIMAWIDKGGLNNILRAFESLTEKGKSKFGEKKGLMQHIGTAEGNIELGIFKAGQAGKGFVDMAKSGVQGIGDKIGGAVQYVQMHGVGGTLANAGSAVLGGLDAGIGAAISGLIGGFQMLAGIVGTLVTTFVTMLAAAAPVVAIVMVLKIIFDSMMQILMPVIQQVLAPLIGIFVIIGQVLGQILVPVLKMMMPFIELAALLFVWLYNTLRPVFELISDLFSTLALVFEYIGKKIEVGLHNLGEIIDHPFSRKNRNYMSMAGFDFAGRLHEIWNTETFAALDGTAQVAAAGNDYMNPGSSTGGSSGSSSEATRVPDQNFYFYIGADAITDVGGGKIVSVDYILDQFMIRLAQTQSLEA